MCLLEFLENNMMWDGNEIMM